MDAGFYSLEFTVGTALARMSVHPLEAWMLLVMIANENNA